MREGKGKTKYCVFCSWECRK